jgi:hypothetical protein
LLYAQTGSAITTSTHAIILLPFNQDNSAMTTTLAHAQNLLLPSVQDNPAIMMATHAEYSLQLIVESLFLLCGKDNSETMASSLLLFCIKDAPAIMMVTHADYSLQLIVESFFTGAKQVASATIPNGSSMLIVTYFKKIKTSLHFRKDCRLFCEGEWEQKRRFNGHTGIIGISFNGVSGIIGQISLSLLIGLCIGLNGHIRRNGLIDHMGFAGHTDIASASIISLVGCIVNPNGLIGLISLVGFGVISFVSLSFINSLSLTSLVGLIGFIGLSNTGVIGFIGHNSLNGHNGLDGIIGLVGFGLNDLDGLDSIICLVNLGGISLISLMDLIGGHISHDLGLVSLIDHIGRISLNGHNDVVGFFTNMEFEIPCYSLVREDWLWCVRRLCFLARLDSDFFFRHAL